MKKSKFNIGLIVGIALVLVALPLLGVCAEPKPQGTVRVAMASYSTEGFLPDKGSPDEARLWPIVYEYLFYLDEKTRKRIPGLAKRLEYSKDGLTLTVYLREGVQFNGGWGEVTAEDVKYSYERVMMPTSVSNYKKIFSKTIKSIEVVDRYTVAYHLQQPAPEFWWQMVEGSNTQAPILCKKYVEKVGDEKARYQPIGSGPFRLVEHQPGQYLKFEAFDKHWRVVPEFKYLILNVVPEESTRVAMLRTGEIDITDVTLKSVSQLQKTQGITLRNWPGGYTIFALFGGMMSPKDKRYKAGYHRTDPWVDKRVREAMNIALDRNAIIKAVYKGTAEATTVCWTLPDWRNLKPIPYDPERAKQLLAEAGYPDGFSLNIASCGAWAPAYEIPDVLEIAAAYFEQIGLKVNFKQMDKPVIRKKVRAGEAVNHVYVFKMSHKDTYVGRFEDKFGIGGSAPWFHSDELTDLLRKLNAERDLVKRDALMGAVRDYLYNEVATIPLVHAFPVWATRDEVVGEWPPVTHEKAQHWEYIRHAKPLNTWRLFTP
jgi:peptide/nickel transport system substrate-binding protein